MHGSTEEEQFASAATTDRLRPLSVGGRAATVRAAAFRGPDSVCYLARCHCDRIAVPADGFGDAVIRHMDD